MLRPVFFLILPLLFISCKEVRSTHEITADLSIPEDTIIPPTSAFAHIRSDTTIIIENTAVDILIPSQHKADLLILPGWNFSRKKPSGDTLLIELLLSRGYRLILPEMGKSVYASKYFPETRNDWRKYPTLLWVTDTMIPLLQNEYGILREGEKNYIAGISTGARGAVLVAARKPFFTAGAALSGDYDQAKMPGDNLMKGVYGEYSKFSERWETLDNPSTQTGSIKTPLYIGHGERDKVVPAAQSKNYYEKLKAAQPELEVRLNIEENAAHDAAYWYAEMKKALIFFEEQRGG